MAFRGVFIGVDRYASDQINWLGSAVRDAVGLHALFTDTLGGQPRLLVDEAATRVGIESSLEELRSSTDEDVVVVAFSGHGTPSHELVPYDADTRALADSCISLESLRSWFEQIPARQLICILDCCFSGGIGAKVLQDDLRPRQVKSGHGLLEQLCGEGRLILAASQPDQSAYEHPKLGHGLLTYFLLQALQGAEEVQQSGKVSVLRLLEYVTQQVTAKASQWGRSQQPTLISRLHGEVTWPVFTPGNLYRQAFPEWSQAPVSASISSLATYGFPKPLLDAWAGTVRSLNQLQIAAINEYGLLRGDDLLVSAPTSSGKTMIGELAALQGALIRQRAVFLLPLKALVNDKERQFTETYGNFGIRTIQATGETDDISPLLRGRYDLALLTYEKFSSVVLAHPHVLEHVGTIVVDEVQMIADESRGANLEFLLTLLRLRRREGTTPQIVALSAVIGDTNGLDRWLGARLLRRTERPVPLDEGILRGDGRFRFLDGLSGEEKVAEPLIEPLFGKGSSQDWIIPLVRHLMSEGKQVIIFREDKGSARGCAKYLARELALPPAVAALAALPNGDPSRASDDLRTTLRAGVAFHTSELDREERSVVESAFRSSESGVRVIAATTTLAMGVNTPASAVVIAGLDHPGPNRTSTPYSIAEYKNIIGRAGRLGYTERGTSYLLALTSHDEHHRWFHYVLGQPEDVRSRFLEKDTDPRSLIVRVVASRQVRKAGGMVGGEIIAFLEESFGAFVERQQSQTWRWDHDVLVNALKGLEEQELLQVKEDNRYELTPLGFLAGTSGLEVESIVRVVECLRRIDPGAITDGALVAAAQLTVELDDVLFPINRKSTQKEPRAWVSELQRIGVPTAVLSALERNCNEAHQAVLRAKKAVACMLFASARPMAEVEDIVTQFGGALGGAAYAIRSVSSRTCDVLPTVARAAELIHPGLDLGDRPARVLTRLDVGVPAEAVDLAMHAGTRIARGDYHRLLKIGLCDPARLDNATDDELLAPLGNDREKLDAVRQAARHYKAAKVELQVPALSAAEGWT